MSNSNIDHPVNVLSNDLVTDAEKVKKIYDMGTAPKVTDEAVLQDVFNSPVTFIHINRTIICHVHYLSKFDIVGTAAVMSVENHNEDVGKFYALEDAMRQIASYKAFHFLMNK